MCGFVGYTVSEGIENQTMIKAMADRIKHRGPDDEGYFLDNSVALGFRRLSIIDLDHGKQPLYNEDESKVLVFNGEIYNYRELRDDLIKKGHVFRTETDSEVLIHGYEEYGTAFISKLRGMYAFVIWDRIQRKMIGARDIFGIKPFYYYSDGQVFMFASEIKAFLPHPQFRKEFNEARLPEYLSFEYVPSDETLFKHVYKLMPGHSFEYQDGHFETRAYHEIRYELDESKSMEECTRLIGETFQQSVKMHEMSDVEIGSFLSSGIDSSYVLHEVAKSSNIKSFSVGYEEEAFSELSHSTAFAEQIGVDNIARKISADDYFNAAPKVQYHMDEPLSNPSAVPLNFVAEEASQHVKVVLSGEGADELFGGYNRYKEALIYEKYQKLPYGFRAALAKIAEKLPKIKGRRFLMQGARPLRERFFRIDYVFDYEERQKILKDKSLNKPCAPVTEKWFQQSAHLDQGTQMQYLDLHTWLVYDILLKADRMSMAHSLELRVPFLDKELLAIAMNLPTRFRVTKENTKVALRKAAIRELPARTANKKKLGFPSPLAVWMKQDRFHDMIKGKLTSDAAKQFFEVDELLHLLEEHRAGLKANMQKIWSVYCFVLWYEQYFGGVNHFNNKEKAIENH